MGPSPGGGLYHIPDFTDNPNLTCITVDDVAHCTEWWNTEGYPIFGNPNGYVAIDSTMYFSSDCASVSVDELRFYQCSFTLIQQQTILQLT